MDTLSQTDARPPLAEAALSVVSTATRPRLHPHPHPHRCRRCGYDLAGLPGDSPSDVDAAGARSEPVCPECALPLRLSRGPAILALGPRMRRVELGCRFVSLGLGLFCAAMAMLGAMVVVGGHYWLDPFSVPALNAVVIGCCLAGWLCAAHGSRLLIVHDVVRGRLRGVWFAAIAFLWPVGVLVWPLIPVVLIALPIAGEVRARQLGRACRDGPLPEWADASGYVGGLFVVVTYLVAFATLGRPGAGGWILPLMFASVTFDVFALAFRGAAREVRRLRTGAACSA